MLLLALKVAGITELRQLDDRINAVDDAQLASFQAALTNWMTEIKSTGWSTNRFDLAKTALVLTASPEVRREILKTAPFNTELTIKIKQELGIVDPPPEPEPKVAA